MDDTKQAMELFAARKKEPGRKICVLHIDDSKWVRIPVSVLLRRHFGIHVLEADSGPEGITIAEMKQPDLIILDIMMPQMDGFDTLARLRQNEKTKDIPVIMCTARNLTRDVNTALRLGATDYITKPIEEEILSKKIQDILTSTGKWENVQHIAVRNLPPELDVVIPAKEKKEQEHVQMSQPAIRPCPSCQKNLNYIDHYQAWYCFPCRRYPDYAEK